jgi:hypothetical protein
MNNIAFPAYVRNSGLSHKDYVRREVNKTYGYTPFIEHALKEAFYGVPDIPMDITKTYLSMT